MKRATSAPTVPDTFGAFIREVRIQRGLTQRDVARHIDMLPSNLCKLEREWLAAPTDGEQLRALARALALEPGTEELQRFFDLAAASNQSLPLDLVHVITRNEAVPLLLRTIGNRRLTQAQIDAVVEIIQKGA